MAEQQRMMAAHRQVCSHNNNCTQNKNHNINSRLLCLNFQAQEQKAEQTRMFKEQIQRQMAELDPIKRMEADGNYQQGVVLIIMNN